MPYDTTDERDLQALNFGKDGYIYLDEKTGEAVEPLKDGKYDWRGPKRRHLPLAGAYREAGMDKYADRLMSCATWLQYLADSGLTRRELRGVNLCHLRLCPTCSRRKARLMAMRLVKVLNRVEADHPDVQFIFLTLTIRNVTGDKLRDALDALTKAWSLLTRRRPVARAVKGWFRAIEITHNATQDTYHPHIHAVIAVEPDYFRYASGLYITKDKWIQYWRESLRADYSPSVKIEKTTAKAGRGGAAESAAVEAAKYACKHSDYIGAGVPFKKSAEIVKVYTEALTRKRMTALGGWLKDAANALEIDVEAEDSDLIHDEDGKGALTPENAPYLEDYGWNRKVEDHVLMERWKNPEYLGPPVDDSDGDD